MLQVDSVTGPPQCTPNGIAQLEDAKAYQEGRDPIIENEHDPCDDLVESIICKSDTNGIHSNLWAVVGLVCGHANRLGTKR